MSDENTYNLSNAIPLYDDKISGERDHIQESGTENRTRPKRERTHGWTKLLRACLPSSYEVVTKGRIIGREVRISREIDVLILKGASPKELLNKSLYLASCVVAAFECNPYWQSNILDKP